VERETRSTAGGAEGVAVVSLDDSAASAQRDAEETALGFRRRRRGGSFAVHAAADERVEIEVFAPGADLPFLTLPLSRQESADPGLLLWYGRAARLPERFEYLVRVDGGPPLVDPYARQLAGGEVWARSGDAIAPGVGRRYRGLVDETPFDWQGVERPRVDAARRTIYELHVRGFTRHASSGVAHPGTYRGVIEKIGELLDLGVTTVELMPVTEFDETENPRTNPESGERLLNFWGYSPVSFFAPKAGFASDPTPGAAARELKETIRELHRAGLEVILDVVLNHTAEGAGGATDPLHSWRGLDERAYYLVDAASGEALDFTGCGNTVNVNHPVTRRLILDALRHWCEEYRVDGFRFDLAAVFFRGEDGRPLERSTLVEAIAADPVLGERILVAEPWDARGFAPPRGFPAPWQVWDGEFRDELRRWMAGREGDPRPLARRLAGVGPQAAALPAARAVRFVACHDGRTLADLVAYEGKHNEPNGEANRDGWDGEVAWNGGVEGPSDDPAVGARREREVRSLLALLAAAPGALLLTAGDERLRTQRGNSNAWCQDNEVGWVDRSASERAEAFLRYVRDLLRLRRGLLLQPSPRRAALVEPFGDAAGGVAGLGAAFLLLAADARLGPAWFVAANPGATAVRFPVPAPPGGKRWRLRLDTGRPRGEELFDDESAPFLAFETSHLAVAPRAVRILTAEPLPLRGV
jgi:glycogen operon protein